MDTKLFARRPSLAMPFINRPSAAAIAAAASNVEEKHTSQNDDDDVATVSSTQTADTTKGAFSTGVKRIAARAGPRLSELLASSFSSFNIEQQQADNDDGSPSSTTSRKQFFHGRSPSFSFSSSSAANEALSEEMTKLAEAINDKRKLLIQELLGLDGDAVIKVRFISAVNQFERCTNKDEKKHMGQKLVEIFVSGTVTPPTAMQSSASLLLPSTSSVNKQLEEFGQKIVELFSSAAHKSSSREATTTSLDEQSKMFVLNSLSEDTTRRLGNGYLSHLPDAKREILQELSRNMLVMQAVSNVNSDVKW